MRLLLDNSLLRMERRNLDIDGHIGIINSRIDRRRRDVASLEQRLDDLEAANALLTAKVAAITGGKGVLTQQAHGEFIVSSETICLPNTQWVLGEYF